MHSLGPYGNHVYSGDELSGDDLTAARKLLKRLNNNRDVYGVETLKMVYTLPSGATAVATHAGGMVRLVILERERERKEEQELPEYATDSIPMLFSGVIRHGFAAADKPIRVEFTDETLRRLAMYQEGGETPEQPSIGGPVLNAPKTAELMRFNVRLPPHLAEFGGVSGLAPVMTQFARTRPTWWTGSMAAVVQVVGGYGSQDFANLPKEPLEQVKFHLPVNVMARVRAELSGIRLPGYSGRPHPLGHFQYDYKVTCTHGITFAGEGNPWLVEINKDGVFVMPLPIIPATATEAFREYIEKVNDHELLYLLDKFGGLPSGEGFPLEREAWERAGVIIKLCDTKAFYDLDPMTLSCGWAFNESGTEAFNTGTHKGSRVPHCSAYKIRMKVTEDPDISRGWMPTQEGISNYGDRIDRYINELYSALPMDTPAQRQRSAAIKYKIRRVPVGDLASRASYDGASDVGYWDNLQLGPIAKATGNCSQVSDGPIYHRVMPAFKLPEAVLEGCISHSVAGLYDVDPPEKYPRCDTIIYGYYIKDQLKVVKYFHDDRELEKQVESDFEDCMAVGNWTEKHYSSPARIVGSLYTSDFDERVEVAESYTLIEVEGKDLGYPSRATMSFVAYFWCPATISRNRYFSRVTKTTKVRARSRSVYCYTPFMMRSAVVYGYQDREGQTLYSEEGIRGAVPDPNTYRGWTYDWSWNWAAFDMDTSWMKYDMPLKGDEAKAPPNPFVVEDYIPGSSSGPCSDWADSGGFEGLGVKNKYLFNDEGQRVLLINPEKPPAYEPYKIKEEEVEPKEEFGNFLSILPATKKISSDEVGYPHYSISPDSFGNVFQYNGTRLEAGLKEYAIVSDTGGNGSGVTEMGGTALADRKTIPQFIGVINE